MKDFALKNIVEQIMKERNIKQKDVATLIGITPSVLSETLHGKRKPDKVIGLLNEVFGVNYDTSKEVNSDVHLSEDKDDQDKSLYTENSHGIKFFEREDGQMLMEIPLLPFNALGSPDDEFATILRDRDKVEMELFEVDGVHHGSYVSFMVDGDSMDDGTYNGFRRGDIVAVRKLDRYLWLPKLHFNKWPYWVVVFGNCVRLKQIIAQDEQTGDITLHSLNPSPEYTDFTLNLNDVHLLYNVVLKKPKQVKYGNF